MKLNDKVEKKLKAFKKLDLKTKIIIIIGIAGIVFIFLSEFIPSGSRSFSSDKATDSISSDETEDYKKRTEKELKKILTQINGVGDCSVMVTVEGTTEYVYAENLTKSADNNGDRTSDKYENQIVMVEADGKKEALVKKVIKPKISGVVIVCEGGGDVKVNERVIKAVSTALDIPSSSICVESKKK